MKASPQIHSIYIASQSGESMTPLATADIIAGAGIAGDRYALGIGAFSKTKLKIRHISLITLEGIEDANRQLIANQQMPFDEGETRRNVIISGITANELNNLVGKIFYLGKYRF